MKYWVQYCCVSHVGRQRSVNQDSCFCCGSIPEAGVRGESGVSGAGTSAEKNLFAVFDGMGGEEAGEVAARIAAETLQRCSIAGPRDLLLYCREANAAICRCTRERGFSAMGTTAAMLYLQRNRVCVCNVGDSRIFRLTGGKLRQISQDHVVLAPFGTKPPLSQNLGIEESELVLSPYVGTEPYRAGDVYLLCSDGLTDMVPTAEIERILLANREGARVDTAAQALLEKALANGGRDNITIVLLYLQKRSSWFMTQIYDRMRLRNGNG